jgi:hypothetical protein
VHAHPMGPPDPPGEEIIEQFSTEFPHWRFWFTRDGDGQPDELMATRRRDLNEAELDAGLAYTLPMGHGGDLREQLAEQTERENALGGES